MVVYSRYTINAINIILYWLMLDYLRPEGLSARRNHTWTMEVIVHGQKVDMQIEAVISQKSQIEGGDGVNGRSRYNYKG